MRRRACIWLALSSLAASIAPAATRPRYGGTLTVQISNSLSAEPDWMTQLVRETLVRLNDAGEPEPELAVSWQRDSDGKRWRFSLRPKVLFHDRKPLNAAAVTGPLQEALSKTHAGISVTGSGMTVIVQSDSAIDNLPAELSLSRNAISHRGEGGDSIGTGPFRLDKWEPGRKAVLAAFEDHWNGRPFLDSVVINAGPLPRQISASAADIWELPIVSSRRVLPEGVRTWSAAPMELVAVFVSNAHPLIREALALAIDRTPIVNVLTQRRGEAATGLLPQWLTGYAFLFPNAPDPARARQMLASLRLDSFTLSYPPDDSLARAIAERVALNAHDAGLNIQPAGNTNGNLRLIRVRLPSSDAALDLSELLATLGLPASASLSDAESRYKTERDVLVDHAVIPLVFLPQVFGISPRVHNWSLRLDNVWVSP